MDFFSKVKNVSLKAVQQGITAIQAVATVASEITSAPSNSRKPEDEFNFRFETICNIIDILARQERADNVQSDEPLNESKIRDHAKALIALLEREDKKWIISHVQKGESDMHDHPCLELFLQNHVLENLCTRAKSDCPRGSTTLVLQIVSTTLRTIRYPLLPHQAVHKSICLLISNASRLSFNYTLASKNMKSNQMRTEAASYVRRIDQCLVSLISVLWRKLSESPNLLMFFCSMDKRDEHRTHQQLDLISSLIPLMGKPKIGPQAKEAMLIALGVREERVDSFLLNETKLFENVISELCKKFNAAVSYMSSQGQGHAFSSPLSTSDNAKAGGVEAFHKILKFCAAIVAVSSTSAVANTNFDSSAPESGPNLARYSVSGEMCRLFLDNFLRDCVHKSLLEHGEQHVISVHFVIRGLLTELYQSVAGKLVVETNLNASNAIVAESSLSSVPAKSGRKVNLLCSIAATYICTEPELLQVFIGRVGSVNREVSMSTVQLLSTLIMSASLAEAQELILSAAQLPNVLADPEKDAKIRREKLIGSTSATVENVYTKPYIDRILRIMGDQSSAPSVTFSSGNATENAVSRGSIFKLMMHKLGGFLSLRLEEQIAVTGLVEKCVTVLSATAVSQQNDAMGDAALESLMAVLEQVQTLNQNVHSVLDSGGRITDAKKKLACVKLIMTNSGDVQNISRARRVIEKENQQVVRILESAVLTAELVSELHGAVEAVTYLEVGLNFHKGELVSPPGQAATGDTASQTVTSLAHALEEEDNEGVSELHAFKAAWTLGSTLSEEEFLSEFATMEETLENLCCGSGSNS